MKSEPADTRATIVPCLRYRDAAAAIDWLCKAFGFEKHLVVPGDDGTIAHAQLLFGNGMIMVGSKREGEYDSHTVQPGEVDRKSTQSPYIIVADADAHCAQAKSAGADIVMEVADQDYGGRLYSCRDPEGHLWNFGTYDPWVSPTGS